MNTLFIRADASAQMGTGHVMRMLALAQAMRDLGGEVVLLATAETMPLLDRWRLEGCQVETIPAAHPDPSDLQATLATAGAIQAEWVVTDGYHFTADFHHGVRAAGFKLMVVDDYAHLPFYDADILFNQNITASDLAYHATPSIRQLLGLKYVLLRREFRKVLHIDPAFKAQVKRVLITMGGADPHNITMNILSGLARLKRTGFSVDVVVGAANKNRECLEALSECLPFPVHLHVNTQAMPVLMQKADFAISAAGSTCWELAAMGVPAAIIVLAENQAQIARQLDQAGAFHNLGWYHEITAAGVAATVSSLIDAPEHRAALHHASLALVDGWGTDRLALALGWPAERVWWQRFRIRKVVGSDGEVLFQWANEIDIRAASFRSEKISWDTHCRWFETQLNDPKCCYFILEVDGQAAGEIRFQLQTPDEAEVHFALTKTFRGLGLGLSLLECSIPQARAALGFRQLSARVKGNNKASLGLLTKIGFFQQGLAGAPSSHHELVMKVV